MEAEWKAELKVIESKLGLEHEYDDDYDGVGDLVGEGSDYDSDYSDRGEPDEGESDSDSDLDEPVSSSRRTGTALLSSLMTNVPSDDSEGVPIEKVLDQVQDHSDYSDEGDSDSDEPVPTSPAPA